MAKDRVLLDPDESVCGVSEHTALAMLRQYREQGYKVDMSPSLIKRDSFDVKAYADDTPILKVSPIFLERAA